MATILNKLCKKCGSNEFTKNGVQNGKQRYHCSPCHKRRQRRYAASGNKRRRDVERRYGINRSEYDALVSQQNNRCAICAKKESVIDKRTNEPRNLAVDHCHNSSTIRGLLCQRCNQAIGLLSEDINIMQNAITYLKRCR